MDIWFLTTVTCGQPIFTSIMANGYVEAKVKVYEFTKWALSEGDIAILSETATVWETETITATLIKGN